MINQNLHRQPVPLDRVQHRTTTVAVPIDDWAPAAALNAMFVAATEFSDTCREYPIVFVKAGQEADGTPQIAPVAVLGLAQGQNLYVQPDGRWNAEYIPAVLRAYPFCIGRLDAERFAICLDTSWKGVNAPGGQPLFDAAGEFTPLMKDLQQRLEVLEGEIQRTRQICAQLWSMGALKDMRFDATLPDGRKHSVDGFLTVDETVMQNLPDAQVGELHRTGLLGLVQLHWVSLGAMRRLVEWHVRRDAEALAAGAPAPAPSPAPAA